MSSESGDKLPVAEDVLRKAIAAQIEEIGMDKLTNRLIRENLMKEFNVDFFPFRTRINVITMEVAQSRNEKEAAKEESSESSDSDSDNGVVFTDSAPKKKQKGCRKRTASGSDSDLLEVGQKKRRAASAPKKNAPKKKRAPREGGTKRKTAYSVCCALTDDLAAIVGKQYMRRSEVVKAMWAYFRSNNLMDPKDKRYVLADEPLMKLFKKRRFLAFGMMKDLVPHIIEAKFLNDYDRAALEKYEAEEEAKRAENEGEEVKNNDDESNGQSAEGSSRNDENSGDDKSESADNEQQEEELESD
uniref:DM2 domain-containing protein n=2 Tax=Parascaris TaxID=6254 RepID=A0A914ZV90_PARUN